MTAMRNWEEHSSHVLHIKNMVCPRCITAVRNCLESLGLHPQSVELGTAILDETPDENLRRRVDEALSTLGFKLLDDPRTQLTEQIKNAVIELVHYRDEPIKINFSQHLADRLHRDYSQLSKLFSETTGMTLEKYVIAQKIERAKELLTYDELTLSEIADQLGYSSTAYLSTQFKSVTGLTPTDFKKGKGNQRKALNEVGN